MKNSEPVPALCSECGQQRTIRSTSPTGEHPGQRLLPADEWSARATELIETSELVTVFVIDVTDSDPSTLASVIRPCLTRSAVLGCYSETQMLAICATGCRDSATLIVRRVAAALERSGGGLALGAHTASGEDVSAMLAAAYINQPSPDPVAPSALMGEPTIVARRQLAPAPDGGIWPQDAWLTLAEEAHRAEQWFSIIVVDLDDPVATDLAASVLVGYLRPGDALGRLGGGELALMLEKTTGNAAQALAALISAELRVAGVTAGVGTADSKRATVTEMLVLASGDAILQGASASA